MTTLKDLEKQRIEKIKSLNSTELNGYVTFLLRDLVKYSNDNYIILNDSAIDDIDDVLDKLDEINDLTGVSVTNCMLNYFNYSNWINSYIWIIKEIKIRNRILNHYLISTIQNMIMLKIMIREFFVVCIDDHESGIINHSEIYKLSIPKFYETIKKDFEVIKDNLYSADSLNENITHFKLKIKDMLNSESESDAELKELGLIEIYTEFINENMKMLDLIKECDDNFELLSDFAVDNVFEKHIKDFYECFDDVYKFHVPFDEFMKKQPKFNIITGEFILSNFLK